MQMTTEFRPVASDHSLPQRHAEDPLARCRRQLDGVIEILRAGPHLRRDTVIAAATDELLQTIQREDCCLPPSLVPRSNGAYRRIQLWHDEVLGYELLALLWPGGACSPIHDHRGAWGMEAVWVGQLEVTEFAVAETLGSAVRLRVANSRTIGRGQLVQMRPPNDVHLCRNPWAREFAVSINVYSTQLRDLTVYEAAEQGWYVPHCRAFDDFAEPPRAA